MATKKTAKKKIPNKPKDHYSFDEILPLYQNGLWSFERVFEQFAHQGICPALINDDFGHWAVVFEGYQSLPKKPGVPDNIDTRFWVSIKQWKKSPHHALIYALKQK